MNVDQIRLTEAGDIVQAYRDRLASHRYELKLARMRNGDVLAVHRKIRATTMELIDAEGYEARCRARLLATLTPPRKRQNVA